MRRFRQIVAAFVFILSIVYACDVFGFFPDWLRLDFIFDIQLVPAILSGSVVLVAALIVLTYLAGRVYCSFICPLGILQDLIIRVHNLLGNTKTIKKSFKYRKPNNIFRYGLLALTVIGLVFGSTYLLFLLDPYSLFSKISVVVIVPIIASVNNLLALVFNSGGSYLFIHKGIILSSVFVSLFSIIFLVLIVFLSLKFRRLWCGTVCPVGAFLGLISRYSLFKVKMDRSKCIACNACVRSCKLDVIDNNNNYWIDYSRCVSCYNCIDSCSNDVISLRAYKKK
jgi:polyferredoxin